MAMRRQNITDMGASDVKICMCVLLQVLDRVQIGFVTFERAQSARDAVGAPTDTERTHGADAEVV